MPEQSTQCSSDDETFQELIPVTWAISRSQGAFYSAASGPVHNPRGVRSGMPPQLACFCRLTFSSSKHTSMWLQGSMAGLTYIHTPVPSTY